MYVIALCLAVPIWPRPRDSVWLRHQRPHHLPVSATAQRGSDEPQTTPIWQKRGVLRVRPRLVARRRRVLHLIGQRTGVRRLVISTLVMSAVTESKELLPDISYPNLFVPVLVWWSGVVVSALALINEVNQRRARLVLRWVTVSGFNSRCRPFISVCNQPATQGQLRLPSLRGR